MVLLIISIIFFLIFFEIVARLSYNFYSNYNSEMWRYAVEIKKHSLNENLPHEHQPYKESVLYGITIKTNNDGFRAEKDYNLTKSKNTFRILVLGDSVTLGWGVEYNKTYPKLLENKLNQLKIKNFEVINMGVGNYNTPMELETLKSKGLKYNPDFIILGYYINDAELTPQKIKFNFIKRNSYLFAFLWDKYINIKIKSNSNFNYTSFYSSLYKKDFEGRKNTESALRQIIQISKLNNITVLVVNFPEFHNFKNYSFNEVNEFVSNITEQEGATYLDLLPYYKNYNPQDIWVSFEDVHPNELGHNIAADAIYTTFLI